MRGICNKSGHTCAPFNLYHGSRVSSFNERPRPHTSRWNGSPVSSSSASRTAGPCGAFRFVPRPRGSAIVVSRVTNRIKAASRHFARRRTTSLPPKPARLTAGEKMRCWAALAQRARRWSAVDALTRSENHVSAAASRGGSIGAVRGCCRLRACRGRRGRRTCARMCQSRFKIFT